MRARVALGTTCVLVAVSCTSASAVWSAVSASGGYGGGAATTVNPGSTPTAVVSATAVSVSWAASTMADTAPVNGYLVRRYDAGTLALQSTGSGCSGTVTGTSCTETAVPEGSWKYAVVPLVGTSWRGGESTRSSTVTVDVTAPTNLVSVTPVTGGASRTGGTVYYRGVAAGSFMLTNAVTDDRSGAASSSTAALSGTTTGWTHTASVVSSPSGGPYVSAPFSWSAGTTSSPSETVTGKDASGNSATASLTYTNDSTAPTGGAITSSNGYATSRSVTVTSTVGSDTGSGVGRSQLQRAGATLSSNGTCGSYGAFTDLGPANAASPYTDTALANSTCYQYRLQVTDAVGNVQTLTSASTAKVDYGQAVLSTSGLVSYWRLAEAVRSITALSTDSFTGTAGATVQSRTGEVGATWTNYSFSDSDAVLDTSGRIRKAAAGTKTSVYYSSATPSSASYSVSADLYLASVVAGDQLSVMGRVNTIGNTFYAAGWDSSADRWTLYALVNGTTFLLGSSTTAKLTVHGTARVTLDMQGSTIRMLVGGTEVVSVTDTRNAAVGRAGFILGGTDTATTVGDTTGLHLDNFSATSGSTTAGDAFGSSTGTYSGTTLSSDTPLGDDPNGASLFNGSSDYVQVASPSGLPTGAAARSVEAWFKTSSASRQVVFSYGSQAGQGQEFGLWIDAGGAGMTAWGYGGSYDRHFTLAAAVNDGVWHHVVKTYDGTSITLYVDGTALPSQAAIRATSVDSYGFGIGAVLNPADTPSRGGFFDGRLDDVSVYSVALTAAQITAHHQLGKGR